MSIHIGTNFDLKSKQFLDSRQGLPKSKDDLKRWSTPVPPGFEICLEEVWYYYDPNINLSDTGHWIPRLVGGEEIANNGESIINGGNRGVTADAVNQINSSLWTAIDNINDRLNSEADASENYRISNIIWGNNIPNNTSYEVGTTVDIRKNGIPTISYKITGKSYSSSTVYTFTEGLSENYTKREKENLSITITHNNFITQTGNLLNLSAAATLNWTYYRFWGSVSEADRATLLEGDARGYEILQSLDNKDLSISSELEASFNCSGGRYPVFAFYGTGNSWTPSRIVIGGLDNSNYSIYHAINMINTYGINIPYHIFILNQIQTGDRIQIRIEG